MTESVFPYISPEGATVLSELRVAAKPATTGKPSVFMLASVPSDECGCPEEIWRIHNIDLLFHFEEDGSSEAFLFAGDWEAETSLSARSMDDLRAKAFQWVADMIDGQHGARDGQT